MAKKFRIRQEKKLGGEGRKEKSSKTQVSKYVGNEAVFHTRAHTHTLARTHTLLHTHARRSTARRPEDHGPALRLRLRTEARSGAC